MKLQRALEVLGETSGPEVDGFAVFGEGKETFIGACRGGPDHEQ